METRAAQRFMKRNVNETDEEETQKVRIWQSNVEMLDSEMRSERSKEKTTGVKDKIARQVKPALLSVMEKWPRDPTVFQIF